MSNYEINSNLVNGNIIINYNHSLFDSMCKMIYDNEIPYAYSDILIEFHDKSIIKINNAELIFNEKNFEYSEIKLFIKQLPSYFKNIKTNKRYNSIIPEYDHKSKKHTLKFDTIFKTEMPVIKQPSIFNCGYYKYKENMKSLPVFGICKNKYGFDTERYTLCYDKDEFTIEQITELIGYFFYELHK